MAICLGCRKDIDPAFDTVATDERGRPWHTSCWVARVGAQDVGINPNADIAGLYVSPPLYFGAKLLGRLRRRSRKETPRSRA